MFTGRIRAATFWKAQLAILGLDLFTALIAYGYSRLISSEASSVPYAEVSAVIGGFFLFFVLTIPLFVMSLGLLARRLQDLGFSAAWILIAGFASYLSGGVVGLLVLHGAPHFVPVLLSVLPVAVFLGAISFPGSDEPNHYGPALTYTSLWTALIGKKPVMPSSEASAALS